MKKIVMIVIGVVMGTTFTLAQPGRGYRDMNPEEIAKQQTERLKEILDLNEDQEKQVYELNLETNKKRREMFADMRESGNREGMRDKFAQIREEENEKMKEILTEEQWNKYQKYLEERRARLNQRQPNRRP
jgi:periplasmic protein CpxP/Spy